MHLLHRINDICYAGEIVLTLSIMCDILILEYIMYRITND